MKIERIRLRNVRAFSDASLTLGKGLVVIAGPNGAGKSTLIEAVGYALFGAAFPGSVDEGDVLRHSEAAAEIALDYRVGDKPFSIERHVRLGPDGRVAERSVRLSGD